MRERAVDSGEREACQSGVCRESERTLDQQMVRFTLQEAQGDSPDTHCTLELTPCALESDQTQKHQVP